MIVTVANMKGGTTKTTSAAFLVHAFCSMGKTVLGVDADPQGSFVRWAESTEWETPVIAVPKSSVAAILVRHKIDYDVIVVDTPPVDVSKGVTRSSCSVSDVVVTPLSPTAMDVDRLMPIVELSRGLSEDRQSTLPCVALFTRIVHNSRSRVVYREVLQDSGIHVLDAEVPRREQYAQSFFEVPLVRHGDPYYLAAEEILEVVKNG